MQGEGNQTRESVIVDRAFQLGYDNLKAVVAASSGWVRESGGPDGEIARVWYEDKEYVFKGPGLVEFLYAVKDRANENLYAAMDLCDYIAQSSKQPASVFVRDAIVARAAELKAQIEGS